MAIRFERGVFEDPDDAMSDHADTAIVVVTDPGDREATLTALDRCVKRWWGIDGAGRHHPPGDRDFWEAQPDNDGDEWHTAKYFSDIETTDAGVEVYVDAQSHMPPAMRQAYRQVLVDELTAAGVDDAVVRSQNADDYEPVEQPTGSWPLYQDAAVPGLPPGIPPGRVLHHQLRRHRRFWNGLLGRDFDDVWQASAIAAHQDPPDAVAESLCQLFKRAGWRVTSPQERNDADRRPMVAARADRKDAVALIICRTPRNAKGFPVKIPDGTACVTVTSAYYDYDRTDAATS